MRKKRKRTMKKNKKPTKTAAFQKRLSKPNYLLLLLVSNENFHSKNRPQKNEEKMKQEVFHCIFLLALLVVLILGQFRWLSFSEPIAHNYFQSRHLSLLYFLLNFDSREKALFYL